MAWTTPATAVSGQTALTASFWNTQVRDNTDALYQSVRRLGFQTRTTNSTSSQTSFASAADLFTSGITFTADGTSAYRIKFYCTLADTSAAGREMFISLSVGGTQTGNTIISAASSRMYVPVVIDYFLTPAAGSRTINFRHFHAGGATTLNANDGTGSNAFPMWMAVYGPAIT